MGRLCEHMAVALLLLLLVTLWESREMRAPPAFPSSVAAEHA